MNKKMKTMNNLVYNNVNKILIISYAYTGTSTYGCATQDYIIDGSVVILQETMQEQEMMEILMVIITVVFILQTMFHMEMESMA